MGGERTRAAGALRMAWTMLLALALAHGSAATASMAGAPDPREVRYEQRLGTRLPLDTQVIDERGRARPLGDFFGKRPVLLAFAYYGCPNLCTLVLNGLAEGMSEAGAPRVGQDYTALVLSIDPREGSRLALGKQRSYLARLGKSPDAVDAEGEAPWHFLTATPPAIEALTKAAGFHYRYDAVARQYAHPGGALVATPGGVISQYLPGIRFAAADLGGAVNRAARSRVGKIVDEILLLCFHYDPSQASERTNRAMALVRAFGAVAVAVLLAVGFRLFRRERAA